MTGLEWMLWGILAAFYVCCLFTVCLITFQKGHTLLGIVGIVVAVVLAYKYRVELSADRLHGAGPPGTLSTSTGTSVEASITVAEQDATFVHLRR